MNILCYSPYAPWLLHTFYELTILHAAQAREANVKVIRCDGLFRACEIYRSLSDRLGNCVKCQGIALKKDSILKIPVEWFGEYLTPADLAAAKSFAEDTSKENLTRCEYNSYPVGEWSLPSFHSHVGSEVDLNDPEIEKIFRAYLHGTVLTLLGFPRLLDDYNPSSLLLLNGLFFTQRVAFELARKRNIHVLCHERGQLANSIVVYDNAYNNDLAYYKKVWEKWGDVPLSATQLQQTHQYLMSRRKGQGLSWYSFTKSSQKAAELKTMLNVAAFKRVLAVFPTSDYEIVGLPGWKGPFPNQQVWLEDTVKFAQEHPEVLVIIRLHPTANITSNHDASSESAPFLSHSEKLPGNLRIILPSDPIDSYALMEIADAGISYGSTAGLEMAAMGKPVLCTHACLYYNLPAVTSLSKREDYFDQLSRLLESPFSLQSTQMAYRCFYYLHLMVSLPFSKVIVPEKSIVDGMVELTYKNSNDLLPGKDPILDRIVNGLTEHTPVWQQPTQEDLTRTDQDERLFFESVEKNEFFSQSRI